MTFLRPIQWGHSHADPIWPDGTFKKKTYSFGFKKPCKNPRNKKTQVYI